VRLTDLNAPGGIGANCLLLQFDGLNILIDTGMHPREVGRAALPRLDRLAGIPLDLIFLTHCHLDHLGALPVIARQYPDTPIIMSPDTAQLFGRMLRNSCTVMERQRAELGIGDYPLYAYRDITACARQTVPLSTGQPRRFEGRSGDCITFTLHPAGHIPGAVGILFEYHHRRVFHTGDVNFAATALLDGARFPEGRMDTLIIETTRGVTVRRAGRADEMERLLNCIQQTTTHGGSILIPVFALGRMQELIAVLHAARAHGRFRHLPIHVSGLGIDLLNQFDRIARKSGHLRVRKRMLRELGAEKLPDSHRPGHGKPSLYLLSSGMLVENTPSYRAAAALLESHRNTIAFTGYCDPDTPGGKLLKVRQGDKFLFKAAGRAVPALARIEKFDLSSHADREELLEFAIQRQPRAVVLTHGDPEARAWFTARLREWDPACRIVDPVPLQTVTV
jgi:Cft2 family RNA processing exonuclease